MSCHNVIYGWGFPIQGAQNMMAIAPKEGRGRVRSSRHVLLKVGLRLEGIHPISPDGENFPDVSGRIHSKGPTKLGYHDNSSTDISSTYISSAMTFLAEIEAGVMKRILYQ